MKSDNISVRSAVIAQFTQVAMEQNKIIDNLTDGLILLDCGLDSLCFAVIVARLEDELGYDPFGAAEALRFPTTVGEFIELYERAG
jgi:acyl carrier protein